MSECGLWVAGNDGPGEFECLAVVLTLEKLEGAIAFYGCDDLGCTGTAILAEYQHRVLQGYGYAYHRSEERRVGKECQ